MTSAILLWIIRVWALLAGSACLPCLILFLVFKRFEHPSYRFLRFYFLMSAITKFLLMSIAMILPLTPQVNRVIGLSAYGVAFYLWMLAVLVHAAATWGVMFVMTGMDSRKKVVDL